MNVARVKEVGRSQGRLPQHVLFVMDLDSLFLDKDLLLCKLCVMFVMDKGLLLDRRVCKFKFVMKLETAMEKVR